MARRRYQSPRPVIHGRWWTLLVRTDRISQETVTRQRVRINLCPAELPEREAKRLAAEYLGVSNHQPIGAALNFKQYVEETYMTTVMPALAKGTRDAYTSILRHHLLPVFGASALRDLTHLRLQSYMMTLPDSLSLETRQKIRNTVSGVMASAVRYGFIASNPAIGLQLKPGESGSYKPKPYLTPAQFAEVVAGMREPYATLCHFLIHTGLRITEAAALQWRHVGRDYVTIERRWYRGEMGQPKSRCSNATISVPESAIERLRALGVRGPNDLVFAPPCGRPMNERNTLIRFVRPAAIVAGYPFVTWRTFRISYAVWLRMAGADVKDAQGQMRHARASTTQNIYQQFVPAAQRRAVDRLGEWIQ